MQKKNSGPFFHPALKWRHSVHKVVLAAPLLALTSCASTDISQRYEMASDLRETRNGESFSVDETTTFWQTWTGGFGHTFRQQVTIEPGKFIKTYVNDHGDYYQCAGYCLKWTYEGTGGHVRMHGGVFVPRLASEPIRTWYVTSTIQSTPDTAGVVPPGFDALARLTDPEIGLNHPVSAEFAEVVRKRIQEQGR